MTGDLRRERGIRSRQVITRHAVDVASLDGLGGLSFGRLADDLEISKPGIQTLFRTKEVLQLATVQTAREVCADAIIRPALAAAEGAPRLHKLIDYWIAYVSQPLFPGGCFWSANLPAFDSYPGPVHDALVQQRRDWLDILTRQLLCANHPDVDLAVYQIDAILHATNIALRLGESDSTQKLRRVIDGLVPLHPSDRDPNSRVSTRAWIR